MSEEAGVDLVEKMKGEVVKRIYIERLEYSSHDSKGLMIEFCSGARLVAMNSVLCCCHQDIDAVVTAQFGGLGAIFIDLWIQDVHVGDLDRDRPNVCDENVHTELRRNLFVDVKGDCGHERFKYTFVDFHDPSEGKLELSLFWLPPGAEFSYSPIAKARYRNEDDDE